MEKRKLKEFTRGWIIGDFEPSLFKCDYEVAVTNYKSGDVTKPHLHKENIEITVFISGVHSINNELFYAGDIVIIDRNEPSSYRCWEDGSIVVFKSGKGKDDKYDL